MARTVTKQLRQLTRRQQALVEAYVENGGKLGLAAQSAGYTGVEGGRSSASKAMKTPHVQQALVEEVGRQLHRHAPRALATVSRLSEGARSEHVQLEASKDLLDRAGFKPIERSQMQVAGDIRVEIDLG